MPEPVSRRLADPHARDIEPPPSVEKAATSKVAGGAGLRRLALRGSAMEMLAFGGSQVIRFGSNLVLTRLLFPEAFGLTASVSVVLQGLVMLSDVGIAQAVIVSERGDDPRFLNTAFTLQVVRGVVLWLVASLLAWPVAVFYDDPRMFWLTCVSAFSLLIGAFHSTALYTLRRRVELGGIVALEIAGQTLNSVVMIVWAWISPSIFCLVAGGLASAVLNAVVSHSFRVGYRNRFAWDAEARREISRIGRWIFGSSALTFVGDRGSAILFAKFFGMADFGVSWIAIMLSDAIGLVTSRITAGVFFPILSRVRAEGTEKLRATYYAYRLRLDAISLPALGLMTSVGGFVILVFWDSRYADAAWMLQILCVRVAISCFLGPVENCLSSMGQTKFGMMRSAIKSVWVVTMVPLGYVLGDVRGFLWASAFAELPAIFVLWPALRRAGVLRVRRELLAVAFYLSGVSLGFGLEWLFTL
jgi:O-antigen/teichoic acid export membrane protein